ncbi:PP2C family protein-serine/threonine phosphatase [Flaviflexus huanghaiensis]|uniref:PP2C family protein-serine/threonine phosphatase n=1 Tax=Flaviflexus huanghaiensis TaxID=1111473 RepID=UPI0015F79A66|nr:protein phosphatase 2C domain-containing protein [Flaviflexus huanghaiensis]
MSVQLRFAARSDIGAVRKSNQDSGYAGPHLLVLADGMGGAAGGDTASSITVSTLASLDDVHQADDLLPLLRKAVTKAHEELTDLAGRDRSLKGMGTTCIAILRAGNKLGMVHIGDSRAYLLRGESLIQVTKDHTLVQYLLDHGQITPEEAENHPKKNVIMRALGDTEGEVELDESVREAVVGDRWLLCSDGLFGVVSNETIADTLLHCADLEKCANRLIELALAGGAPDNVTVVLADILDDRHLTNSTAPDTAPIIVGAAASRIPGTEERQESGADERNKKRRWPARLAVIIGFLVLAAGALFGGWFWTQSQYYVYEADGNVAIYRGVPQTLGPVELSHLEERSSLAIDDLTETAQRRLREPVTQPSRRDAERFVADLESQFLREQVMDESSPEPTDDSTEQESPPAQSDSGSQPEETSP